MQNVAVNFVLGNYRNKVRNVVGTRPTWCALVDSAFAASGLFEGVDPERVRGLPDGALLDPDSIPREVTYLVCVSDAETLVVRHLRQAGHQVLGLLSQLIPRLVAFAPPRFAPAEFKVPERRFAIISTPRAGSTVLAMEVGKLGFGSPTEHIQRPLIAASSRRDLVKFSFDQWRAMLEATQQVNGTFGTKIIWDLLKLFRATLRGDEPSALDRYLREFDFIYIRREDKLAQATSDYLAGRTKVWHKWPGVNADYDRRVADAARDVDWAQLEATYVRFVANERELADFLKGNGARVIPVDFDEVAANPPATARRVVGELGGQVPDTAPSEPALQPTQSGEHERLARELAKRISAREAA